VACLVGKGAPHALPENGFAYRLIHLPTTCSWPLPAVPVLRNYANRATDMAMAFHRLKMRKARDWLDPSAMGSVWKNNAA
jgi:hypothetical protein